jgi:serine/threonine protein kinase
MEYIHGRDLRATFDRAKKKGEILPLPMACFAMMKVCEGLDYAHNKKEASGAGLNLVHRDVSPQNILLSFDGEVKIIDFGIAKAANKAAKTQAGILKGKFGYMSPEQVRGLPLDRRSDIFSCGIILYELVTGERLFIGESDFSTLEKVRNVEIMPPTTYNRAIPEELERIVLKALAKEKEDRYQAAMDLHDDLQSFMYTIESFFSQKDLATFMRKEFPEDLQQSGGAPAAAGAPRGSKLPPPRRSALPPARASAPPPRASAPPPRASAPPPPKRTIMGMPAIQVPGGLPADGSAPPPPPSAPPPPPSAPPPPPALAPTLPAAPPPPVPPPIMMPSAAPPAPLPPAPLPPAPAPAPAPAADAAPGEGVMEWDDEEMATQIYGQDMLAAAGGGLAIDTSGLSATGAPVPARSRPQPSEPRAAPAAAPAVPWEPPRKSRAPLVAGLILALAAVLVVVILMMGKKGGETARPAAVANDAGQVALAPADDAGTSVGPAAVDATAAPTDAAVGPVATADGTEVIVVLAEELKPARFTIDGEAVPWKRALPVPVPPTAAEGHRILRVEWDGHECREPTEGGCPAWKIDAATEALEITAAAFRTAPLRVAIRGNTLQGFALYERGAPAPGSTEPTYTRLEPVDESGTRTIRLPPGTHPLVVRQEGSTGGPEFALPDLVVPDDPSQTVELAVPRIVELQIGSSPAEATVLLARGSEDPVEIGKTGEQPIRVLVDSSLSYRLRIALAGYKAFEEALSFPADGNLLVRAPELERQASTSSGGSTSGGRTSGGRTSGGRTSGGSSGSSSGSSGGGETGMLTVITQPWTMVYIDGRRIRETPLINHPLPAGRYTLTLLNQEQGIRKNEIAIVQAGRTTTIRRTADQLR